jgi:hypothetical protein
MTIKSIAEVANPNQTLFKPIKEKMDIYILDIINENISRRNGMVYVLTGSGGSGKSSLLLNMFKSKNFYRNKFHHIHYFCPQSSFLSVAQHPFEKHDKVYHELTVSILQDIYSQLSGIKEKFAEKKEKKKKAYEDDDSDSEEEDKEPQYSCIIIDDFADTLKDKSIALFLSKIIIKARHLCCSFIFTLQSYYYMPKILRKQVTYTTIFKPKNYAEWASLSVELFNLSKEDGLKVYNYVFDENYNHIDIDLISNKYYKNFNLLTFQET